MNYYYDETPDTVFKLSEYAELTIYGRIQRIERKHTVDEPRFRFGTLTIHPTKEVIAAHLSDEFEAQCLAHDPSWFSLVFHIEANADEYRYTRRDILLITAQRLESVIHSTHGSRAAFREVYGGIIPPIDDENYLFYPSYDPDDLDRAFNELMIILCNTPRETY